MVRIYCSCQLSTEFQVVIIAIHIATLISKILEPNLKTKQQDHRLKFVVGPCSDHLHYQIVTTCHDDGKVTLTIFLHQYQCSVGLME